MNTLIIYVTILALVSVAVIVFSQWIGLKIVGLKAAGAAYVKVISIQIIFLIAATTLYFVVDNSLWLVINMAAAAIGFILWSVSLKRFAPNTYTFGKSVGSYIISYIFGGMISAILAAVLISSIAQVYRIDDNRFTPKYTKGDRILAYKFIDDYKVGDVVQFNVSTGGKDFTPYGQVIGVPGQAVDTRNNGYSVANNPVVQEPSYTLQPNEYMISDGNNASSVPLVIKSDKIRVVFGPVVIEAN